MTKKKPSTSVRVRREQMHAQKKRQRRLYYVAAAIGAIVIIGFFAIVRQLTAPSLEDVVLPANLESPSISDGKTWGPLDAPVLIEEYGDFQ